MEEELRDDKLVVYRVGQVDDFKNGLFFADKLDYFDYSDTGYAREDAVAYELDLNNAKIFDPVKEWNLSVNTWSDMRQSEEFFKEHDYPYYEYLDDVDYDDEKEYHEVITDTDYLSQYAYEEGYDVIILRDIPGDGGRGPEQTEYCVFNKNLIKELELDESMSNKLFEYYEENNELSFLDACKNRNINFEIQDDKLIFDNYKDVIKCIQLLADMGISFKQNKKEITLKDKTHLQEKIVKKGSKWQVQSEDGSKNLGTYDTKAEAEKRLQQVHYFKHINESYDKYLYHATFGKYWKEIQKAGYIGNSKHKNWDFSNKGVVCLAKDSDEAYSYCDSADDVPESVEDSGIVVLKIDTDKLDKTKLDFDRNQVYDSDYITDDMVSTYEYSGTIPLDAVVEVIEESLKQVHYFKHINEDLKWDYKNISKDIVSNLEDLTYWNDKSFGVDVYVDDWDEGCDIEATYSDEYDKELAWLVVRVYQDRQAITFRQIDVYENGGLRGTGFAKELVSACLEALPKDTKVLVHMDFSGGFWYHMSQEFKDYDWDKSLHEDLQETDNEGNILSKEQIDFFKNSKVRDKNDKLCVCYHATNKEFDTFDASKWDSGEGSVWGKGFYFFNKYLSSLRDYGNKIMKCYLNIVNPIKEEPEMFAKLLISNFGDFDTQEFERFRKRYHADYNDEIIVEMFAKKKFKCNADFAQLVMNAGYDGRILGDDEIICYYSNQIKSIDNKNPTNSNNINESKQDKEKFRQWSEDDLDVNDYIAEKLVDDELDEVNESVKMKKDMKKVKSQVKEAYVPTKKDFPYTLKDIEDLYSELISSEYQSYGNAFIMPDGRFILSGKKFDTHADFAIQCTLELTNKEYDDLMEEWNWDDSRFLEAFTTYFNLVRVNDGSKKDVEPRAYFVINSRTISAGQEESLLDYLDFVMKNKNSLKQKDLIAFVRHDVKLWILGFSNITDDIMSDVKFAMKRGFFESLDLKEDINKYYRIELEDQFGDRSGIFVGAFELIPTKETIENYPEDFDLLTDEERARYYKIDELISKLGALHKSPGVDTNFDKFKQGDIFAFTSETYKKVKDIVKELKPLVAQLGLKIIVNEVDVDDEDISFHDEDQVAFSYSDKKHKFKEIEESSKYDSSENVSLKEAKGKDTFIFKNKKAWSGAVNTLDGTIEEVHSYEEAQDYGFHHSFYFSDEQLDKMEKGETCFFCVFNDGKIMINAMSRFNPEDVGIKLDEKFLEKRIREQIKIITNEDMQLTELMRGKENISDEKILKYIEECIADMKTLSFAPYDYLYITYDDIDVEEGDTARTFGTMYLPQSTNGNFKLVLNKHMFEESEEAIKNTIYHELCHYVVYKMAIENDIFYRKNGHWFIRNNRYDASDYKGHGRKWKQVAQKVSNAFNTEIKRTNNYAFHTGVGAHAEDKYKYIVKCKHCGNTFKYFKKTDFIKSILDGKGHTEDWWCKCKDGTKGHDFEIVKGK